MGVAKVILNGTTLIDVTDDTVASSNLLSGYTATGADGETVSGSYTPPEPNIGELEVYPTEEEQTFDGYSHSDTAYISKSFRSSGTSTLSPALIIGTKYWVRARIFISDYNIRYFSAYFTASSTEIGYYKCGGLSVDLFISNTSIRAIKSDMYDSVSVDIYEVIENKYDGYNPVTVHKIPNEYVGSSIPKNTSSNIQISGPKVTIPNGYYSLYASVSIPAGTASVVSIETSAPQSITFNSSTGLFSASFDYATHISPAITSGYISSGTSGIINIYGSSSFQLSTLVSQTITPGTSDQTISAFNYLVGSQTIKGDANLVASNIRSGVSIFGVQGALDPGGGGGGSDDEDAIIKRTITSYSNSRVSTIGQYAFYNCRSLEYVSFLNCHTISTSAFNNCVSLSEVSFPVCEYIYDFAFSSCYNLKSVNFPKCKAIYATAFLYCSSLTTASFPECSEIMMSAFKGCRNLSEIYFPSCSKIGAYAFQSCSSLINISFPVCSSIGSSAFQSCSMLQSASFPSVSYIDMSAFQNCYNLSSIFLSNCISIHNCAFMNCSSLSSIDITTVNYLGVSAFANCIALKEVSNSIVTQLTTWVFAGCVSLTKAHFPLVSSLASSVFKGCTELVDVNLDNCQVIYGDAFLNCTNLKTISLPKCTRLLSRPTGLFQNCYNLISLYLMGSSFCSCSTASMVFHSTPMYDYSDIAGRFGSIFVPSSLYDVYISAPGWSLLSSRFVSM